MTKENLHLPVTACDLCQQIVRDSDSGILKSLLGALENVLYLKPPASGGTCAVSNTNVPSRPRGEG